MDKLSKIIKTGPKKQGKPPRKQRKRMKLMDGIPRTKIINKKNIKYLHMAQKQK